MTTIPSPPPFPPTIARAILAAQRAAKPVGKDARNAQFGYQYASSESVIEEARAALNGAGLALVTMLWSFVPGPPGENGFPTGEIAVDYALLHAESGEALALKSTWFVAAEKGRPLEKAIPIALTSNLAYVLRGLLVLPRLDEEGERDRGARPPARPAPPPAAPGVPTIPYGQTRGTPLHAADERDLTYCIDRMSRALAENKIRPEERAAAEKLLDAMKAELAKRVKGASAPAQPPPAAQ